MLILVMVVSACSQSPEKRYEEGEQLLRNRAYDDAIEIFEGLLDEDPLNYDAWHDLMKALVRDQQLAKASDTLTKYYETVKEDYQKNESVSYQDLLRDVLAYGYDIRSGGGYVADWIDTLQPGPVSLDQVPYDLEEGDLIELDVPEGMTLYWTLDGSKPDITDESQRYLEPLTVNFDGEKTLTVVAVNDFGLQGPESYTWVSVYERPEALSPSVSGGTYDGPIVVFFPDYDYDTMDLYYTLDGSDPIDYGYYYEETGIRLIGDSFTLRAAYYDYNTGAYSSETQVDYVVSDPYALSDFTEITLLLFAVDEMVASEIDYALSDLNNSGGDFYINSYSVDTYDELLDELSYNNVDLIYSGASYVEDLVADTAIVPVTGLMDLDPEDYINDALEAGVFQEDYYHLPVTVNPNMMLYYNTGETGDDYYTDIDTWDQLIDFANDGRLTYNFIHPENMIGEWLFGYYLGFGGSIDPIVDGFTLDEKALADAMTFVSDLPTTYGLGYTGMDSLAYHEAIEDSSASLVYANTAYLKDYDYYYSYIPAGQMPLPNGGFAGAVNLVDGFMITDHVMGDSDRELLVKLVYDTFAYQTYANYIAGYGESIPAVLSAVDMDSLWLDGYYEDYEHAVSNNVTIAYTYDLFDLFETMTLVMQEVLYEGTSPEDGAKTIVDLFDGIE